MQHTTPKPVPFSPVSTPSPRAWEEVLRDVQRTWSEAYQDRALALKKTPVPIPCARPQGC